MDALFADLRAKQAAVAACADEAALPDAKAAQTAALHALLLHVAAEDVAEDARRNLDAALAADAAALKNALLKALRSCALHRAFLGLPALLEETRRLLTAASAKLVATTLEVELCADVEACEDARALGCVVEVLNVLLGSGKLKKELGGFDLSAPAKKSCRTALNKATRRLEAAQQQQRRAEAGAAAAAKPPPAARIVDRDVRLEDREAEEARAAAHAGAIDAMFERAMAVKEAKPKGARDEG